MSGLQALRGLRVVEFAGLAPVPFAGMILADFGANVIRVDKASAFNPDTMTRGKRSIALNLKSSEGIDLARALCQSADVVVEPFRPGVMEKLGLGPDVLMKANPALVYARLTGFGQTGPYSSFAGHDINYISVSGVLSKFRSAKSKPHPPLNMMADFAGGSLSCVMGIAFALIERNLSGKGQVIDASMVDGSAYAGTFLYKLKGAGYAPGPPGTNWLDGGAHFYQTYACKDGKFIAVGAIEPQFYSELLKGLQFNKKDLHDQMDQSHWPQMKEIFASAFATKTRDEWAKIFHGTDACVTSVLEFDEAASNEHNVARSAFIKPVSNDDDYEPAPAPKMSRTPAHIHATTPLVVGQHTREVLQELGFGLEKISQLQKSGAILIGEVSKL